MTPLEFALALGVGVALFFGLASWRHAARVRRLEQDLPAALFTMAAYEPEVPVESVLSGAAAGSPEPLRSVFLDCVRQIQGGVPTAHALSRMGKSGGVLLDRAVQLLQAAHRCGADLSDVFRKVAQDAHEMQRLESARREAFALPKYTLYAGAALVPALLGTLYARTGAASSIYGTSVFWGLQVYLVFFGLLSAAFVAVVESNRAALAPRALALSALGLAIFHAVRLAGA